MSDRLQELETARDRIDPRWDASRMGHVLDRVRLRIRAEERRRRVFVGFALAASLCGAAYGGVSYGRRTAGTTSSASIAQTSSLAASTAPSAPFVTENVLNFPDGSSATSTIPGTRMQVAEANAERMLTVIERGAARFEVVHDAQREFRVRVEGVTLTVLGTVFLVERTEGAVMVSVERGRVRVEWSGGTTVLESGERGAYPFGAAAVVPTVVSTSSVAMKSPGAAEPWRALARRGLHREAWVLLHDVPAPQLHDAEELLAAADVARLSGHPAEAIPFLQRVLKDFRKDPRAPLAAFGLGRILLAGRPAEAAVRFAEARAMAPSGAIAEDALAREVEAWSRAGEKGKAHAAAEEYVRRYPQGNRLEAVKKMGGL
jgi:transmembrane sensor